MRVAGGRGDDIEDSIQSNIKEYAAKVKIYDDDEEGERPHDGFRSKLKEYADEIEHDVQSKIKEYAQKVKPHHHGGEESNRVQVEL
jgi:hypothetical protein